MKKKLFNSFFLSLITNIVVDAQCVTNVSATLSYVSNSGGNCTYNFTPSAIINNTPNVKLVEFTLPAGSTPSLICYSGDPIMQVPCTGGYTAINNNSTLVTLSTVSVIIPCASSTSSFRGSTATPGTSTCTGPSALTVTGANPVKISYFKGISNNSNEIGLYWQTEVETNSSYFVIERSGNAQEFSDLKIIKSTGESTSKIDYQYTDKNPLSGINYYRLRQVDNDGSSSYSKIIDVKSEGGVSETILYPNPSEGTFILKSNEEILSFEAFTTNGEKIDIKLEKNGNEYWLNFTSQQDAGTYFLKVKTQNGIAKYRVIVN